ncbi:MAG: hypothetical protein IKO07_05960 [Clostridia bacterium]|nr:hypothetical protein [Clostridia bacterium]
MSISEYSIQQDGTLVIGSLFELERNYFDVSSLIQKCKEQNCTLRFENENLTITPGAYDTDLSLRAQITAYSMIATYPQAAIDYTRYCFSLAEKKKGPNAV